MEQKIKVKKSSGNVFADLALPDPDERLAQADLTFDIYQIILSRGLTADTIAHLLRVDEATAHGLVNAEPTDCSTISLKQYLTRLKELSDSAHSPAELAAA